MYHKITVNSYLKKVFSKATGLVSFLDDVSPFHSIPFPNFPILRKRAPFHFIETSTKRSSCFG